MIKLIFTLSLSLLLTACAPQGQFTKMHPPTNEEFIRIFFANGNYPLRDEPKCIGTDGKPYAATIGDYFSIMADSIVAASEGAGEYGDPLTVSIIGNCDTKKYEYVGMADGSFVTGWHCGVTFYTHTRKLDSIDNLLLNFVIKPDLSGIVKGSVSCLP